MTTGAAGAAVFPEADNSNWGTLVDTAEIPGGGQLQLRRQDENFEIVFRDEQLMGSWDYSSEKALATLVADRLGTRAGRVLIGGLGMGFTLAAARAAFPSDAKIVVAELVPQVVNWARGPLAHLFEESFLDARVSVEIGDVHDVIVKQNAAFDAILLDVDNGPDGLIHLGNERLYCNWGLRAARDALRPDGMLAVWSAYPDQAFSTRLERAGFDVEEVSIIASGDPEDPPHVIWLASRLRRFRIPCDDEPLRR